MSYFWLLLKAKTHFFPKFDDYSLFTLLIHVYLCNMFIYIFRSKIKYIFFLLHTFLYFQRVSNILMNRRRLLLRIENSRFNLINQESSAFKYLLEFSTLSEAKSKVKFWGTWDKELALIYRVSSKLRKIKRIARNCFISVFKGFLGNHRTENF